MDNKTKIYNKLIELSEKDGITTQTLASILGMNRSNVSYELNRLFREGKVTKSSGRPVLFYLVDHHEAEKTTKLDEFGKFNTSLTHAIEQAKSAILYPPHGLPTLILGGTGVGKSMFASLMYNYGVDMKIFEKDSPFIVFNCADYSNNPQLLISQLFGVKKGTYTGAEFDKNGLIEEADGGVLFLDEIHRLPPEGQEALFTFLDSRTFRRMGDNKIRTSNAFIISATTEDPKSSLLQTFTRRIPISIIIPPLRDRSFNERLYLIKSFFKQESINLNREIYVSCNSIRAFLSYDCANNVGQLKSDVQIICAKAYSEFLTNIRKDIRIETKSLPFYIREGLLKEKEHRMIWNELTGEEIEFFRFSPAQEIKDFTSTPEPNNIYGFIEDKLALLKHKGIPDIDIEHTLEKDIFKHFQKYIMGVSNKINKKDITNLLGENIINCVDRIVHEVSKLLNINFSNSLYTALALHVNTLIKRATNDRKISNPQIEKIMKLHPNEFAAALHAKDIISDCFHYLISDDEVSYLALFFLQENNNSRDTDRVKIILIAHGESTASSMAQVANNLLDVNYALAIDAPMDISPSAILDKLKKLVKNDLNPAGYLLLVDMGSLTTFSEIIEDEFEVPTKSISLISTLHVIEATRKALLGFTLEEIYNDVLSVNSYVQTSRDFKYSSLSNQKIVIITTCLTGEGGSVAVKSILHNSLKFDSNLFEIISLNCLDKSYFKHKLEKMQKEREVLFIISSFPLDTNIKQYSMYDVISMNVIGELQELIDVKTTLIKMPLVLKENIQNLNGEDLYNDIMKVLVTLQTELSIELKDSTLVGLILHIAFMVSRLKDGERASEYKNKKALIRNNLKRYEKILGVFNPLSKKYSIKLSDNEICYLMDYLFH